jgi:uncharacterized protein YlxW (UPF0749 family)
MSIDIEGIGDRIKPYANPVDLLQFIKETNESIRSLQRAVAGLRKQVDDFRIAYEEDAAEIRRRLWELRWITKERF